MLDMADIEYIVKGELAYEESLDVLAISACLLPGLPAKADRVPELDAMTNEELITSLDLGKQRTAVRDAQGREAKKLINSTYAPSTGCNVETYRSGEVIIITIPAELLFQPNSADLLPTAEKWIRPLKKYAMASKPDYFRMLLVMHTDNTGSTEYTDQLSLSRVDSILPKWARRASTPRIFSLRLPVPPTRFIPMTLLTDATATVASRSI